ncbi:MAG: SPOR domain-containing protein [Pelagimonas sp.]|jgi:hypothetical protein|nr:SPOR domain-containing protein [Pelagimonas sp.]
MADYTYQGASMAPASGSGISVANLAGAAASLALIVGVGVWGYGVMVRDVSGVPIVQAMSGPMRVAPENPGGNLADHQGLAVNQVAGQGSAAGPTDQVVLAPRPAGLGAEDVALGAIVAQDGAAPLAETPQGLAIAQDDPIQLLANQLAAGIEPLEPLNQYDVTENASTQADPVTPDVAPEPVVAPEVAAAAAKPGLARSLRPKLRPSGLKTASLTAAATAAQANTSTTREIEAASLPAGTRLVQIGAFDSAETARAEWQRFEARFGEYLEGKNRVIQKATSGGRVFYRLRAEGFADLSAARRFCAAFVAQNVDCIPVVTR